MEKLKNIPSLRFPEFEGEWENTKLGNVAKFSKGKGISKSEISENGINECIRYGELYTRYGEVINDVYSKTNFNIDLSVVSEANDVIIPASGETQIDIATASCVLKSGVILGGDLNIIKTNKNGVFLSYYLNNKRKLDIANLAQGISVVHLYSSQLALLNLNFPSLKEQTKIASFLSEVDYKLQTLKQKKNLLEQYKKGVMQKIFSQELRFKDDNGNEYPDWEVKKLEEVIQIQGGYAFKSNLFNQGQTKVIRIGNIEPNIFLESFDGVYSKETPGLKYIAKKGDFLMALSGATFGKVGKIKDDGIGYINQRVALFKTKENLEYYYQLVQTDNFRNYINSIPTASAQPNISNGDILNFESLIPCIEEQTKIANFLSAIEDKINHCQSQIEKIEVWKKGLLQQMFV
jgi:type I restriction enzyme S subunit